MHVQFFNPINDGCDVAGRKRNLATPVGFCRILVNYCRKVQEALRCTVGCVPVTKIWAIDDEIGNGALVEFREPGQHVERRHMAGGAWPQLPVGKALEGLWVSRPPHVPPVGSLSLAPAVRQTKGAACVHPVLSPEGVGHVGPGLSLFAQARGESELVLLDAADLP